MTSTEPLDEGWKICFDFPFQAGRNQDETNLARNAKLAQNAEDKAGNRLDGCVVHQIPGTHR